MMIFAIDDEPKALRVLCRCVEEAAPGAELRAFDKAADALDAIRIGGLSPDIVFSDIEMPGASGLEFAVALKTASPDTRVVFVTAFSQYALDAFRVRAQGYIMKPLTPRTCPGGAGRASVGAEAAGKQAAGAMLRQL